MIIMIAECITDSGCSHDKPFCVAGFCKGNTEYKAIHIYILKYALTFVSYRPVFDN